MKCTRCGANLPDGSVYCDVCGEEVRIVPDYSSLDELLAAQVRGEIELEKRPPEPGEKNTTQNTKKRAASNQPKARRKKETRKRNKKKKSMRLLLGFLLASILIGFIFYQSSYAGQIQKGQNALKAKRYNQAMAYFRAAAEKDAAKADAYIGISEVYIGENDLDAAEEVFLTQIEEQEENADIYISAAEFYKKTKQVDKIPLMLEECNVKSVLDAMPDYVVDVPKFSLKEGTYEEIQKLELSAGENEVYYTLDLSEPSEESGTKYGTEILLDEGERTVKAVSVNKNGIPSLIVEKKYAVELPLADPPIVSPSTGLYESARNISIQVEDGFTAYYLFDHTNPTAENGKKYTKPIKMPEGNHIFSAVLVDNATKKISGVTVRNYDLKINKETSTAEE